MKSKLIHDSTQKTHAITVDAGDELVVILEGFFEKRRISAANLGSVRPQDRSL